MPIIATGSCWSASSSQPGAAASPARRSRARSWRAPTVPREDSSTSRATLASSAAVAGVRCILTASRSHHQAKPATRYFPHLVVAPVAAFCDPDCTARSSRGPLSAAQPRQTPLVVVSRETDHPPLQQRRRARGGRARLGTCPGHRRPGCRSAPCPLAGSSGRLPQCGDRGQLRHHGQMTLCCRQCLAPVDAA
jgi:hypothetical protein